MFYRAIRAAQTSIMFWMILSSVLTTSLLHLLFGVFRLCIEARGHPQTASSGNHWCGESPRPPPGLSLDCLLLDHLTGTQVLGQVVFGGFSRSSVPTLPLPASLCRHQNLSTIVSRGFSILRSNRWIFIYIFGSMRIRFSGWVVVGSKTQSHS